jgi:hypothetical protein
MSSVLGSMKRAAILGGLSLLYVGGVNAQSLTASTTNAFVNQNDHVATVVFENGGSPAVGSFDFELPFDTTLVSIAAADISANYAGIACSVLAAPDRILCFANPAGADTQLPATATITMLFDIGANTGIQSLNFGTINMARTDLSDATGALTVNNGAINISAEPPVDPAISFSPNGGAVNLPQNGGAVGDTSGSSTITVTASGGGGGGTGSYNCAVPAGFAVTNNANAAFGNGSVDMGVTCTMAAAASNANMTCAVTDSAGSRDVVFNLACPAGASAVYSSNPAPGNALAGCQGGAGSTVNTTLTITNTGTPANPDTAADDLALACSITSGGGNFAIASGPTTPLEAGSSTTVTVACTIPGSGSVNGTLSCNGNDYPLSATVRTAPVVDSPAIVPASSFWSKMILFGLLAGLGMLVVSLRRNG